MKRKQRRHIPKGRERKTREIIEEILYGVKRPHKNPETRRANVNFSDSSRLKPLGCWSWSQHTPWRKSAPT